MSRRENGHNLEHLSMMISELENHEIINLCDAGGGMTNDEAQRMREVVLLSEWSDHDTRDIPEAEWLRMLTEALASSLSPDPAHDVTGNGAESHYDLARQLEMRGYDVDADTEDNEHSYVRFNGELVGDIYGDSVASVTSIGG